jgi:hypothetical protein
MQITHNNDLPAMTATQQQEADILRALEVSPYELVVLEKHLLSHGWIPQTTNEEAMKKAVFNFHDSFFTANRYKFHRRVSRLNTLFDAFNSDKEDFLIDMGVQGMFDIMLNRETLMNTTAWPKRLLTAPSQVSPRLVSRSFMLIAARQ